MVQIHSPGELRRCLAPDEDNGTLVILTGFESQEHAVEQKQKKRAHHLMIVRERYMRHLTRCEPITSSAVLAAAFCLLPCLNAVGADNSFDREQRALSIIADFADRMCKDIPLQGAQSGGELSGAVKAELRGVARKVAELGVEGAAKYQTGSYESLLQSDLANALKNSSDCKLRIFDSLKDRLLPGGSSVAAPKAPAQPRPNNVTAASPQKVLLWVDDQPKGNMSKVDQLRANNVKVIQVATTDAAVEQLAQTKIDLIITDLTRAEGTSTNTDAGFQLIKLARAVRVDVPIVIFINSAQAAEDTRPKATEAGVPITAFPEELDAILRGHGMLKE